MASAVQRVSGRPQRRAAGAAWLLPLASLAALLAAPTGFVAPRPAGAAAAKVSRVPRSARGGAASGSDLLDELMRVADTGDKEQLDEVVDKNFGRLAPEDLTLLQTRFAAAVDDDKPAMEAITLSIQAAMENRMQSAKLEIDKLLQSSGDIDANIRAVLKKQDSPMPLISILQINIQQAKANGGTQQEQALTYILTVMAKELQQQVPLTTRLLSRLLATDESEERRALLRAHMTSMQESKSGAAGAAAELGDAIVAVVADAEMQFEANSVPEETQKQTLELIRNIALDAGVVVGDTGGDEMQGKFTDKLQPLFDALSKV
mmetsp:Transcript_68971/g.180780  ORF Transcript_68971/g.180780 Transcript_68971/m.180780 type:complete len:319 (+) Transcript_68971:59-1015(+)